jgi:hypothetical protein
MTRGWRGVALGLALASGACASSSTGVEEGELEGRWEWRSASGGIAGRTITPASEGYTMELRFDDDEVGLYRGGALQRTAEYRLTIGREGSFPGQTVIRFDPALLGWEEMSVDLSDDDTLLLVDGCCDGYAYTFARVGSTP